MKLNRGIWIGAAVLFGGAFYALTQQVNQGVPPQAGPPAPNAASGPKSLAINFNTWEVSSQDYSKDALDKLNTVEARLERARVAQEILNPRKSGTRPGQDPGQVQREGAAAFAITHPGLQDAQLSKTPEQIQAIDRAKQSILNPRANP